jgi:uncharacterized repeat protein (TIGR02543 family)
MKKIYLGIVLLIGFIFSLGLFDFKAEGEVFDFTYSVIYENDSTLPVTVNNNTYGSIVTIDSGTLGKEGFEFAGFVIQGKVTEGLVTSFRVTQDTVAEVYFKPLGSTIVIFMDSNQSFDKALYTDVSGYLNELDLPSINDYSKPGLIATGFNVGDLTQSFLEDTLVYPIYQNNSGTKTLNVTGGSGTGTYEFNQTVTVEATDQVNFSYWIKDGLIASLDPIYTFTMASNHVLEAIYDENFTADSDIFISKSNLYSYEINYFTIVGQFDLPTDEAIVEYGVIVSAREGGITLDTPEVSVVRSNKYNNLTNEFVLSFETTDGTFDNYRTYIKTINTSTDEVSTTYSYYQENQFATDLIISEYIEGSSNNKVIELYNGTNGPIDLSNYSLELYSNGSATSTTTDSDLTGIILAGDTYTLWNSSATTAFQVLPGQSSSAVNYNGDDTLVLKNGSQIIDSFGQVGFDPGSSWTAGDVTTVDRTLVRKSSVLSGDSDASDIFDPSLEWNVYPQDTTSYLGSHQMDSGSFIATKVDTPSSILIDGVSALAVGNNSQLFVEYPASSLEGVYWVSSNETVLTVDEHGTIYGISEGVATITAYSFYDNSVYDAHDVTVSANPTFTITYNLDGGVNNGSNPETFNSGDLPITLSNPTKSGFNFDGWYLEDTFENRVYTITEEQSYTLYAKWIEEGTTPTEELVYSTGFEDASKGSYAEGTIVSNDLTWTLSEALIGSLDGDKPMDLKSLRFRSDAFATIDNDFTNLSKISFYYARYSTETGAELSVLISNDGGINWTEVFAPTSGPELMTYTEIIIDYDSLTGINYGDNIRVKFVATSSSADKRLVMDNVSIYSTSGSTGEPGVDTTAPEIILDSYKTSYLLDETVILGCTATDNVDPNPTCSYTGSVLNAVGDYDITYTAEDNSGNISTLIVTYTIYDPSSYLAMDLMTYYDNAEGLSGTALVSALRTIVNTGFVYKSYDDARYILDETDADPNNPSNVILIYTGWSVSGVWDAGATWNREHVWPQSLLGYDTAMSADLHNLKPADPGTNSSRSNKYFDYITDADSYEPRDEVKGDVARILLYMTIKWDTLTLVDTVPSTYEMALLSVLLEWHELDPVDDFERNRNEVIYSYQNNRNPFIDYPHFVELIYG